MGIVSGCNSKWIHLKEQRFKGQIGGQMGARQAVFEAISPSVNTAELRCCIPIRPVTFRALFPLWHSNGIFYGDFTFLLSIHMKGDTVFPSKGYRQGNTSALTLCCVSEAERTQKDGNELVRSCKNGCQEENESGTENEICILRDPCVCKGFFSPPPRPASPLLLLFPRWSWVRGWAAAWGGKSVRQKLSFWRCMKPSWQPYLVTPHSTTPNAPFYTFYVFFFTSFTPIGLM